jgi:hypothetical protein
MAVNAKEIGTEHSFIHDGGFMLLELLECCHDLL